MLTVICPHCGSRVSLDSRQACCRDWLADMRSIDIRSPHALLVVARAIVDGVAPAEAPAPEPEPVEVAVSDAGGSPETPAMVDLG